ncbi:unnamed protein product [Somion occarium]|uniref:Mitochondrial protein n=1 Tax=Somion occarium TaxID=3059160 RepID=A0ABP1D2Y0_9APHY
MILRNLPRFYRPLCSELHTQSPYPNFPSRKLHGNANITDPPASGMSANISLAHPRDPASSKSSTVGSPGSTSPPDIHSVPPPSSSAPPPSPPPPIKDTEDTEHVPIPENFAPVVATPPIESTLPSPHQVAHLQYATPPFNTHKFCRQLELSFPRESAEGLMRATRALLVDRIGKVRRDALTSKDLESQEYLFKAALSELRTEMTMRARTGSASMRSATAALRREVDALDGRMKEDLSNLKHEIQMELDNRKNEARNDMKRQDIQNEELLNKSLVTLGELRTMMEEARWDNMRNSVAALTGFLLVIVLSMELLVTKPKPPPPPPKPDINHPEAEGLQKMDWVT